MDDTSEYLLLTPGPLTTTRNVREAMLRDVSTWDVDYNSLVQNVRTRLTKLAASSDDSSCVLMQGSGTFGIEATIGTVVPADGCLLVVNNGAYGARMLTIARRLGVATVEAAFAETEAADADGIERLLKEHEQVTHVAAVHCETTSGLLNPISEIGERVRRQGRVFLVDAMSSFGGIEMSLESMSADLLVSSSNKCIQGVPGFSFVIARREVLEQCEGRARSLSLDLYEQWREMEEHNGKWRFTSPTHTVLAFAQALEEHEAEGGVVARQARYTNCQRRLVDGMRKLGIEPLLDDALQSPIITAFRCPEERFSFQAFYDRLKERGFVIYPGKVTTADTFRIGTTGEVHGEDIERLLVAIGEVGRDLGYLD